MTIGIYTIRNKINNKTYVGKSIDIERRWKQHIASSFKVKQDSDTELHRAIAKYSPNSFDWSVVEKCRVEILNEREKYWIKELDTVHPNGYNYTYGGDGGGFQKLDEDSLNSIIEEIQSNDKSIKEIAEEFELTTQMVYAIKNGTSWTRDDLIYPLRENIKLENTNTTCSFCGESKTSYANMCHACHTKKQQKVVRPLSTELMEVIYIDGFRGASKKYGVSDKAIRKWCISYGLPHRINEIKKWWETHSGIEVKDKNKLSSGRVAQIDKKTDEIINVFTNAIAAAEFLGDINYNKHISSVCTGKRKHAYGYKWRRLID